MLRGQYPWPLIEMAVPHGIDTKKAVKIRPYVFKSKNMGILYQVLLFSHLQAVYTVSLTPEN